MAMARNRKVLVLADDARFLLPIARSLGRRGIRVHAAGCPAGEYCLHSRFVRKVHPLPEAGVDAQAWRTGVAQLIDRENYDLVLPATESVIHRCRELGPVWAADARVVLLSDRAFELSNDKSKTYQLARSLQIPTPESVAIGAPGESIAADLDFQWPAVLKPVSSTNASCPEQKQFVRVVASREDLVRVLQIAPQMPSRYLLQQFIPGRGAGIEFLAWQGEVLFAFQHVRLHETSGHGSTYRMSVEVDERLRAAVVRLARELAYTGVGMAEFRVDDSAGTWTLVELNGRFWGSLSLAVAAGADFPYYLYQMLVEGQRDFPQSYQVGVRSRSLFADFRWHWHRMRNRPWGSSSSPAAANGWETNPRATASVCWDAIRGLACRDHVDSFALDDPLPAVAEAALILRSAVGKSVNRFLPKVN